MDMRTLKRNSRHGHLVITGNRRRHPDWRRGGAHPACRDSVAGAPLHFMLSPKMINLKEVLLIAQIERDETWLLGERVGHAVDAKCADVIEKVLEVVLRCAAEWRKELESEAVKESSPIADVHRRFISSCHGTGLFD